MQYPPVTLVMKNLEEMQEVQKEDPGPPQVKQEESQLTQ
jgi:hypothetical protein